MNAERGADGVELLGDVDLGPVDVDGQGAAVAEHGALEAVLEARELLVPVELGMGYQSGVVVEPGKEKDLALLAGMGGIGKPGAVHGICLPQVTKVSTLEAAVRLRTLLGQELGRRRVAERELTAQGARGDGLFRDGLGAVHAQCVDDGSGRTPRLLALEGLGSVKGLGRDGARLTAVAPRFRLEAVKATLLVLALPASQRRHADGSTC